MNFEQAPIPQTENTEKTEEENKIIELKNWLQDFKRGQDCPREQIEKKLATFIMQKDDYGNQAEAGRSISLNLQIGLESAIENKDLQKAEEIKEILEKLTLEAQSENPDTDPIADKSTNFILSEIKKLKENITEKVNKINKDAEYSESEKEVFLEKMQRSIDRGIEQIESMQNDKDSEIYKGRTMSSALTLAEDIRQTAGGREEFSIFSSI